MTIALWIINILLAVAFLGAGSMKLARSKEALVAAGMGYAEDFSAGGVANQRWFSASSARHHRWETPDLL